MHWCACMVVLCILVHNTHHQSTIYTNTHTDTRTHTQKPKCIFVNISACNNRILMHRLCISIYSNWQFVITYLYAIFFLFCFCSSLNRASTERVRIHNVYNMYIFRWWRDIFLPILLCTQYCIHYACASHFLH